MGFRLHPKSHSPLPARRLEQERKVRPNPSTHGTMKSKLKNFPGIEIESVLVVLLVVLVIVMAVK